MTRQDMTFRQDMGQSIQKTKAQYDKTIETEHAGIRQDTDKPIQVIQTRSQPQSTIDMSLDLFLNFRKRQSLRTAFRSTRIGVGVGGRTRATGGTLLALRGHPAVQHPAPQHHDTRQKVQRNRHSVRRIVTFQTRVVVPSLPHRHTSVRRVHQRRDVRHRHREPNDRQGEHAPIHKRRICLGDKLEEDGDTTEQGQRRHTHSVRRVRLAVSTERRTLVTIRTGEFERPQRRKGRSGTNIVSGVHVSSLRVAIGFVVFDFGADIAGVLKTTDHQRNNTTSDEESSQKKALEIRHGSSMAI